jgi:monoamine oxidase
VIDAVVVGAGAAGLACARALADAGLQVEVLEAQTRIGGRVHTVAHEAGVPIEAGAEFVQGRSKALWRVINKARLKAPELVGATHQLLRGNKLEPGDELWAEMMQVIGGAGDRERTVAQLLEEPQLRGRDKLRDFIAMYVEGFHAARVDRASVRAIWEQTQASDEHTFRIVDGY